jgi:hypothetical protein
VRLVEVRETSPAEALALGPALLSRAAVERVPWMAATVVRGPAVLLGAGQRAGRVVRLDACAAASTPVLRRCTAGTAAYVGGEAIVWTLALPHVAALVPDTTPRTLLNRNVRGFLEGFRRAGAMAHYFGREWISVRHRPAALLGFEVTPEGAVLIEVIAGMGAPVAIPEALAAPEERELDRWLGKAPAGLGELMKGEAREIAAAVTKAVTLRAAVAVDSVSAVEVVPVAPVTGEDDPMPAGVEVRPGRRVPIGWIDVGIAPATGEAWVGGDVLVPGYVRAAVARDEEVGEVAVDGATVADLRDTVRGALTAPASGTSPTAPSAGS